MKRIILGLILLAILILPFNVMAAGNITLNWNASADQIDNYKILMSNTTGGPYSDFQTVPPDVTTYLATNLPAGNYCFVVVSTKVGLSDSPYSNECCSSIDLSSPSGLSCSVN